MNRKAWRKLLIVGCIGSAMVYGYANWTFQRMSPFVHWPDEPEYDPHFPREFPYPDQFIIHWRVVAEAKHVNSMQAREAILVATSRVLIGTGITFFVCLVAFLLTFHTGRRAKGLCLECGYDLRGSVDSSCPECGTAITMVSRSHA